MFTKQKGFVSGGALLLVAVLAVVVLVVAVVWATSGKEAAPTNDVAGAITGGNVNQVVDVNRKGINAGSNHVILDADGTITEGSNQASWRNTTGRTVYIDRAEVIKSAAGTSTSYIVYVGTSTASTFSSDFTAPTQAGLVDGLRFASSSAPRVVSNLEDGGTDGETIVKVADGEYVLIGLFQGFFNNCSGSVCETATSTARDFNLDWYLRGHYKP